MFGSLLRIVALPVSLAVDVTTAVAEPIIDVVDTIDNEVVSPVLDEVEDVVQGIGDVLNGR